MCWEHPVPSLEKLCTGIWKIDNKQKLGYILYEICTMYAQGVECTGKGDLNQNRELGGVHLKNGCEIWMWEPKTLKCDY